MERRKKKRKRTHYSVSEQLGYYVCEYIIRHYLPVLSCESIHTNHVIKISEEEQKKYDKLHDDWFYKSIKKRASDPDVNNEKEWNKYLDFYHKLVEKYIPEKLECYVPILDKKNLNIELFKEGFVNSLWQSDISHYSCKTKDIDIIFRTDSFMMPVIILKREI